MGTVATRVPDDRLEKFLRVKRANDRRNHIHELEVLLFHLAREQMPHVGRKLEKSLIEQA